jgi:predicted CoA-substrate-specific enzyme activase
LILCLIIPEFLSILLINKRSNPEMIVAGIDIGSMNVHVCVIEIAHPAINYVKAQILDPKTPTPKVLVKYLTPAGNNISETAEQAYDETLSRIKMKRSDVGRIWVTGISGKSVRFADHYVLDAAAYAYGVLLKVPTAKTIIDTGAVECKVIKIKRDATVLARVTNEAGSGGFGVFCDNSAKALEVTNIEMAELSLQSTHIIFNTSRCPVFGNNEVISLIRQKTPKHDIARAVYDSITANVMKVANTVGMEDDVAVMGGMAKDKGYIDALKRATGRNIQEPHNPEFVGAFGTAVAAAAGVIDEHIRTE